MNSTPSHRNTQPSRVPNPPPQRQPQTWGKQHAADSRRAAAVAIINATLDATDRRAEEEGEPPDLLQYLDDVARHLLTLVEDPS